MIRRSCAVRFDGLAEGGRNEPLRVAVETDDGEEIEVFLKPSGRPEVGIEGMANELAAACIAAHLGLPTCEPLLVEITREWIASIPDAPLRAMLTASSPVAFGSRSAGNGWRKWRPDDRLLGDRRPAALSIFAFDAFTENRDRLCSNPNLLVKADALRIIDHETCFRIRMLLFPPPEPWRPGYLASMVGGDAHVLGRHLKGDRLVDVAALRPLWTSLSDDALFEYEAVLPAEWEEAIEPTRQALTHLKAVRDRIDDCLAEVERVLA